MALSNLFQHGQYIEHNRSCVRDWLASWSQSKGMDLAQPRLGISREDSLDTSRNVINPWQAP